MTEQMILDTGPLVAFLNRNDRHHDWALEVWAAARPPFLTCEPVITEAVFLLRRTGTPGDPVLALVENGTLAISFAVTDHAPALRRLLAKYRKQLMDLADACLVRMSELFPKVRVLTVDTDFRIYRRNGRQVIPVCMPGP